MPNNPALRRTIAHRVLGPIASPPRRELAHIIPQNTATPRLIERDPVLDFGPESPEHNASVVREIGHKLLLVEEAAVPLLQLKRQVPVEESDQRRDSCCKKVVYQVDVVLESFLVDWVVSSAQRDDTGPGW